MPRFTVIRKQVLNDMMKEALFEATVAVLSGYGVDGMTMDRVATEAGVAKGSLYRYFRSKRELLEFVFTKLVNPIFQAHEEMAAKEQPAIEILAEQLHALLEYVALHAQVKKLLFEDEVAHGLLHSSERPAVEAASQRLAGVFRQGIAEGVFRPEDPLMLAQMYLGLCSGVLQSQPKLEERDQREALHHLIMDTFLNGTSTERGEYRLTSETVVCRRF